MSENELFQVEQLDRTVIVTAIRDLRPHGGEDIEALYGDPGGAMRLLESQQAANVIVDCRNLATICEIVGLFFVRLLKRVKANHGRFAVCNPTAQLQEMFGVTHLDRLFPVFDSLAKAFAYVQEGGSTTVVEGVGSEKV